MPTNRLKQVLHNLRQSFLAETEGGPTDGQLLAHFVATRDERAFAALVRRHGPMVMGVCRRVLRHQQDAEDAFQVAFLVLARKAARVVKREAVGSYLYIIAYRTALAARARSARLQSREKQVENMPHPEVPPTEIPDWKPILDQELSLLSERYRSAIVLCDLEERSHREAARQLGVPLGTLSSWLHRGRVLLAKRLERYRLVLPGGALAAVLAGGKAAAAVPAGLEANVVKSAALVAAGQSAGIAAPTSLLMREVLGTMLITKLKGYLAITVAAVLLGAGILSYRAAGQSAPTRKAAPTRALSDLDELRREVEILKLQMDLMQKKVRDQAAEIRSLKEGRGQATAAGKAGPGGKSIGEGAYNSLEVIRDGQTRIEYVPAIIDPNTHEAPRYTIIRRIVAPEQEAEEALKALRAAAPNSAARQKAMKALEAALNRLKQEKPSTSAPPLTR